MMRFTQSKIVSFSPQPEMFAISVAEQFDLPSVQIEWSSDRPHQQENVLVRHVSQSRVIASRLWRPFRFIDLFAGIGGMRLGFEAVGGQCVFSSEWDTLAQDTYEANFGERPSGDITQIHSANIPNHDILLAGFPCQPFSIIGKREGFTDTRGTLFFEIERILREKKPMAFLLENVMRLIGTTGSMKSLT